MTPHLRVIQGGLNRKPPPPLELSAPESLALLGFVAVGFWAALWCFSLDAVRRK